ncbi:uncharacterized protein Z520_06228 [Fonsecaea multimorphosa CBS 102226]|uniref:Clr5 domain-containing protein n=1 Tax=Fonsecaea multimorphosa CBS 102226 TaxID=1442371 RepID=A0A0D2KN51_9EURO|nr:uncharacterized protein Z520_06228 [Fonsecaea multimorphosa CBS 102226]KIX98148.1 hypothetical protein Z520_06228 [Fonsecaea multimorphosa CBS 102226]OAL24223.1 hypothetical protein AYO22_05883 [Fonsecaea multimorphosa]
MANARRTLRGDPFIQQDPNASRYSRRLSREQWADLKPRVLMLCNQGVRIADILREIQTQNIPVTRSQLDRQIKLWRFQESDQEFSLLALGAPQDTDISQQATFHDRALHNLAELLSIDGVPISSTSHPAITNTGSTLESKPPHAEPASLFGPTAQSQSSSSQQVDNVPETDFIMVEWSPILCSACTSANAPVDDASIARPQSSEIMQDEENMTTERPSQGQESLSPNSRQSSPGLPPALPDKTGPRFTINIGLHCCNNAKIAHRIFSHTITKYGASIRVLNRLAYMASLLFLLKCNSLAFQISLHIVDQISRQPIVQGQTIRLLPFFVINCVYFARESLENRDADRLGLKTYDWLWSCHPSGQEVDQQTHSYMQFLIFRANSQHYRDKEAAYWILNAVRSSLQEEGEQSIHPDMFPCDSADGALRFFHEDKGIRNVMEEAIGRMKVFLRANREEIDAIWIDYWQPQDDYSLMGRILTRLMLRPRLRCDSENAHDWVSWEDAEVSQRSRLLSRLREHVLIGLCGLIGKWFWEDCIQPGGRTPLPNDLKPSVDLTRRVASLERVIKDDEDEDEDEGMEEDFDYPMIARGYEGFIDDYLRYLTCMSLAPVHRAIPDGPGDEHLVGIIAILAKVSTTKDLDVLGIPSVPSPPIIRSRGPQFATHLFRSPYTMESSQPPNRERESQSTGSLVGPPLARSCTSSISSGYRSFKAAAMDRGTLGPRGPPTIPPVPSVDWSGPMSLTSNEVASIPSDISLREFESHAGEEDFIADLVDFVDETRRGMLSHLWPAS